MQKKALAAVVVVILLAASISGIWYIYFRHWSISELEGQVIFDPGPGSPGFKHSLAGKSVVVEGRVTAVTTLNTTLGTLTLVELDDCEPMPLRYWGSIGFEIGDRIERKVSFEWSQCNDESHVYSPQLAFPTLQPMYGIAVVIGAVFYINTGGGTVDIDNVGSDVRTLITWIKEPIPLDSANCTLRAGRSSYATDYVDALGNYQNNNVTDRIESLSHGVGEEGKLEFLDANDDGYLDNGDFFMFRNLTRPDTDSGFTTYVMTIEWLPDPWVSTEDGHWASIYYPFMNEGVVSPATLPDEPIARFHASDDGPGTRITVDFVDRAIAWDNVTLTLGGMVGYVSWQPTAAGFSDASPHTIVFPGQDLGTAEIILTCTDSSGDGLFGRGDCLSFSVAGGLEFQEGVEYEFSILDEVTGYRLGAGVRIRGGALPSSPLTVSTSSSGTDAVFSTVHSGANSSYMALDVSWDELMLVLSDGTNVSGLCLSDSLVLRSPGVPTTVGTFELGSLLVVCRVTDLNGDKLINRGDRITLTPIGTDGFPPSGTYSLHVLYLPESSIMSFAEFTG